MALVQSQLWWLPPYRIKYLLFDKGLDLPGSGPLVAPCASTQGSCHLILCDSALLNYWKFAEWYFSPQTLLMLFLPEPPFIPFYFFINPYSSLTVQLRYHFLFLPGWIKCPILLYISIRVISTLNQFIFLFKSKLHTLRGCFVHHCLPTTLAGCLYYMATIQLPKNIQKVKRLNV